MSHPVHASAAMLEVGLVGHQADGGQRVDRSPGRVRRLVVVGFDHMHVGDQLRTAAAEAGVQLVGAIDADARRMARICRSVGLDDLAQVSDQGAVEDALESWAPEVAVVCSTTAQHQSWVERLSPRGIAVMLEKPFGPDLAAVDAMIATARTHQTALAVNWPAAWSATHRTAHRLIRDGEIGAVTEVHYYGGNRGPLHHLHDKIEVSPSAADKAASWWYSAAAGGGSLLDYLGYGTTLGTWFRDGELPATVTATTYASPGLEVDEQSVVVAAYAGGLSSFQTRWGTFTDPWTHRTQPRTGFVVVGTEGTLSSFDYDAHVTLQNGAQPGGSPIRPDVLDPEVSSGLGAVLHHLDTGEALDGPMSAEVSRSGQLLVDAALLSARTGRRVAVRADGVRVSDATADAGSLASGVSPDI